MASKSEHNQSGASHSLSESLATVQQAASLTRFHRVDWIAQTGSTNTDLAAVAARSGPEQVLIADLQTSGRGRRNRTWQAPRASGLLMSFLIRDRRGPAPFWTVGSVALAAAEVASALTGAAVGLKWPNDLMIGESKVAGVLAQGVADAVIVGIGINVDWSGSMPEGLSGHATSLNRHCEHGPIDRPTLAADLVGAADGWLRRPLADVHEAWSSKCLTLGRQVRVELDGAPDRVGEAMRVAGDGALVVAIDGTEHTFHVADVVHLRAL